MWFLYVSSLCSYTCFCGLGNCPDLSFLCVVSPLPPKYKSFPPSLSQQLRASWITVSSPHQENYRALHFTASSLHTGTLKQTWTGTWLWDTDFSIWCLLPGSCPSTLTPFLSSHSAWDLKTIVSAWCLFFYLFTVNQSEPLKDKPLTNLYKDSPYLSTGWLVLCCDWPRLSTWHRVGYHLSTHKVRL